MKLGPSGERSWGPSGLADSSIYNLHLVEPHLQLISKTHVYTATLSFGMFIMYDL